MNTFYSVGRLYVTQRLKHEVGLLLSEWKTAAFVEMMGRSCRVVRSKACGEANYKKPKLIENRRTWRNAIARLKQGNCVPPHYGRHPLLFSSRILSNASRAFFR